MGAQAVLEIWVEGGVMPSIGGRGWIFFCTNPFTKNSWRQLASIDSRQKQLLSSRIQVIIEQTKGLSSLSPSKIIVKLT